ncbi:MAG: glycosyltransferase family 4 protein [Candidatus Omnitrophica bacterium]|nr:glycosyltransferase family 4 protein [Candidatus Omnitrophota bacterium]
MKKKNGKKLNIAHLHWGFPPVIGGVETHLTILLPTLVELGHNVSLLTGSAEGAKIDDEYRGVKILRAPIMDLNWLVQRGLHGIEKEVVQVYSKFIDRQKPDILHAHNMHYFSRIHAKMLEKMSIEKGIPLFLTAHNVWDDDLYLELVTNVRWTHIIAVSHFIEKELIGVGCSHHQTTTVHHGIDEKMFNPKINPKPIYKKYPQLKDKRILFHPARMGMAKGCDVSIKALRLIKERVPEAMLVLAGTKNIVDWGLTQQKDIAYMVHLVERFNLRDNVLIDSYLLEDMPMIYAACQVCIYPSTASEPFGLTMLEAMASAKPMVVTKMGGMPEIIGDGINGFVIPVKGYEELASRVIQLFSDDELRDRLGNVGRNMVEKSYTRKSVAQATLRLYDKFANVYSEVH